MSDWVMIEVAFLCDSCGNDLNDPFWENNVTGLRACSLRCVEAMKQEAEDAWRDGDSDIPRGYAEQ